MVQQGTFVTDKQVNVPLLLDGAGGLLVMVKLAGQPPFATIAVFVVIVAGLPGVTLLTYPEANGPVTGSELYCVCPEMFPRMKLCASAGGGSTVGGGETTGD